MIGVARILAVDWGEKRIGLAVSDPRGIIATGLATLEVRGLEDALTRVAGVAAETEAESIVVGDVAGVDAWAREHLAPAQRPKVVHTLDALPRTTTGKVLHTIQRNLIGLAAAWAMDVVVV